MHTKTFADAPSLTPRQFAAERRQRIRRLAEHYERFAPPDEAARPPKPVRVNGVRYASTLAAAIELEISACTLRHALEGKRLRDDLNIEYVQE